MPQHVSDESVLDKIHALAGEERRLYEQGAQTPRDQARLETIRVELDQCWDLLRQRRARREFGQDPDDAALRPASIVENYQR